MRDMGAVLGYQCLVRRVVVGTPGAGHGCSTRVQGFGTHDSGRDAGCGAWARHVGARVWYALAWARYIGRVRYYYYYYSMLYAAVRCAV